MKLADAERIGAEIVARLKPWCEPDRCMVAGSVRRRRPECGDIEIVCEPRMVCDTDMLFGSMQRRSAQFMAAVDGLGCVVRGQAAGRYACRLMDDGTQIDVFMARPDNWGLIVAIRTGSREFARRMMMALRGQGYLSIDGEIVEIRTGLVVPVVCERDVFALAGLAWVEPEARA